jgi:hypothetical protein
MKKTHPHEKGSCKDRDFYYLENFCTKLTGLPVRQGFRPFNPPQKTRWYAPALIIFKEFAK